MQEVFDTFTNRPKLYYILIIGIVAFLIAAVVAYDMHLSQNYIHVLGSLAVVILLIKLILSPNLVNMYIKDGELKLAPEAIIINSVIIPISDVKSIEIKASDYKGKGSGTSDGSGNRIEITDKNNVVSKHRFVITGWQQQRVVKEIVAQWKAKEISVETLLF